MKAGHKQNEGTMSMTGLVMTGQTGTFIHKPWSIGAT